MRTGTRGRKSPASSIISRLPTSTTSGYSPKTVKSTWLPQWGTSSMALFRLKTYMISISSWTRARWGRAQNSQSVNKCYMG
jgi:hypothetical protein